MTPSSSHSLSEFDDVLEEDSLEEDPFGDAFAENVEGEGEGADDESAPKPEFSLHCPHGEAIERKRVFGFIDFQHKSDGKSCDILNKFNVKSAKVSEILADGAPRSIRDDSFRAFLLTSPKKRKEYFEWMGKLTLYEFLAEVKLLDRFVVLRHGPEASPYKLGVEVYKAFGKEIIPAIDYLFPNEEYLPNSVARRMKYYRQMPDYQPAKVPVKCLSELEVMLQMKKDNEDMIRNAEIGRSVPGAVPTGAPLTPGTAPVPNPLQPSPVVPMNNANQVNNGPFAPVIPTAPLNNNHPAIGGNTPFFQKHNP